LAGAPASPGLAVVIEVTPEMLARSRRHEGVLHTTGVVEMEGLKFGLLMIRVDDCGHLVVFPLGTPEVSHLLETVNTVGVMHVVMADKQGDGRIVYLRRGTIGTLLDLRGSNPGVATQEVFKALIEVVAFLASEGGSRDMPEALMRLDQVTVHALVPESLLDNIIASLPHSKGTVH
jgi:hypothetical protein